MRAFHHDVSELMRTSTQLRATMAKVNAHDRVLQVLVSKEKECPSLFWFYPKDVKLRHWLSNPTKCLFQDTLMMVVVCPVTLCAVECGPKGVGWEVNMPKKWLKEWAPAILMSIYVLQAAVLAGRLVGIPLPTLPSAGVVTEALGLKSMLGDVFQKGVNHANLENSLNAFKDITEKAMDDDKDLNPEIGALCAGLKLQQRGNAISALPNNLPMRLVDEAYKSIHTFLTTEHNAKLGKLEDQLRGRMERMYAPNGEVEWVSMEGKDIWMQKHAELEAETLASIATPSANLLPQKLSVIATPSAPTLLSNSWLAVRLRERGMSEVQIAKCELALVVEEAVIDERSYAKIPPDEITRDYVRGIGITAAGSITEIIDLHTSLNAQHCHQAPPSSALFTEDDRKLLQKLRLEYRSAPPPQATNTVDRGRQKQYTASSYSQGNVHGCAEEELVKRIADLEARQARSEDALVTHMTETGLQFERIDDLEQSHRANLGISGEKKC